MLIQWSDEDEIFIVTLPEFGNARTHGETRAKAIKMGQELIESFFMWHEQDGDPLPKPHKFVFEEATWG